MEQQENMSQGVSGCVIYGSLMAPSIPNRCVEKKTIYIISKRKRIPPWRTAISVCPSFDCDTVLDNLWFWLWHCPWKHTFWLWHCPWQHTFWLWHYPWPHILVVTLSLIIHFGCDSVPDHTFWLWHYPWPHILFVTLSLMTQFVCDTFPDYPIWL
jgi:DNA-binding XRE family transcriptional regulator